MTQPFQHSRRARFAAAYAQHGIAERAAVEAGYSPRTARAAASRLLTFPGVREELTRLAKATESDTVATLQEVRERMTAIARSETASTEDVLRALDAIGKTMGFFLRENRLPHEIVVRYEKETMEGLAEIVVMYDDEEAA